MVVVYFKSLNLGWMTALVGYDSIEDRPVSWDTSRWMVPGTFTLED